MTGQKHNLFGEFVPEWCALAALVLADALIAARAGINFHATQGAYWLVPPLLGAAMLTRRRLPRLGMCLDYFALLITADIAIRVLTYLCTALAGPLMDAQLMQMDRALGFDWPAYFHFVLDHPRFGAVLAFLYFRIGVGALYFFILMSLMGDAARMREIFRLLFAAALLTAIGAWLVPSLGPFQSYGYQAYGYFLPEMNHLRSHADMNFPLGSLQGVIGFPSFHTIMALALAYGFRGTGVIGKTLAILGGITLFAIPVFGGHYLSDMIGGALVLALAFVLLRPLRARAPVLAPA